MPPPPKKQLRWGRLFGVFVVFAAIVGGVIYAVTAR